MAESVMNETRSLDLGAEVELFEIDYSGLLGDPGNPAFVKRIVGGTDGGARVINFQGKSYDPLPLASKGFNLSGQGQTPRPTISMANVDGLISALTESVGDLIGAIVTRRRTYEDFLDGAPRADRHAEFAPEVWTIARKVSGDFPEMVFELASAIDLQSTKLPKRTIEGNHCPWVYASGRGCGWTKAKADAKGLYFDVQNQPVSSFEDPNEACAKLLSSCKLRFETDPLTFGGFPGSERPVG